MLFQIVYHTLRISLTAFTTGHGSNVGISNTSPTHMLSVGDKIFMSNTGTEFIKVEGNVRANRFFSGSSVLIDGNSTNKIQVSGTIKTGVLRADNIGISNTSPTHALSLGNEGQLRLNVPTESIYALETVGNVSAQNYIGDGGLLSNVTLQTVTDKSNVTSNTIHLTNPTTSLKAYSNVIVDGTLDVGSNLYVNDTAANVLDVTGNVNVSNYLKTNKLEVTSLEVDAVTAGTVSSNIVGNNVNVITVTANVVADNVVSTNISSVTLNSNVIADNVSATTITGDGSAITALNPSNLSSQVLIAKGGTGLTSIAQNELLLGPASGTALDTLPPYNADATKKFLRSSAAGIAWDDVSSTLQTITDGGATTTNEISFTNGVTSLTASGNVVATGNVTASTFKSTTLTSGKIPYVNNDNELIDGPIGHDSTTNNTFVSSNLYVTGNLTVQGTTTFQDSNIHTVSDPIIEIGNANAIDTIDMGVIMTRPTANVVSGYMGDEKKYVIAYTLSDPDGAHIVPTNATSDQFMTLSVEGGNVLAGNVITTGLVEAATLKGDGSAITALNPSNLSSQVLIAKGGTGLTSIAQNELLLGPASGTALDTLPPYNADATKKFLRSSAAGIAWDDVSSTLQTITDGGATTTHTIAFNNTTTGLTSAGDIDIAATKQIDYAGDVLLKSSAGAVASLKVNNAIKLDPAYAAPSNNVLSFNTTTGEIYDSGGQGGSTLDNIHEEGSNVAIGPSAASANLTVNTYGSNVLTVSGNVSADNITIGALNVAASPFALDDVVSVNAGANVTANVLTLGGLVTSGNVDASNIIVSGNTTSQNIKLTNTDISATISSGTITIDAREKSYGTAPLVVSTTDVSNLVFSNLITGAQIVVPILASGGDINISKELTNVNFYAMTTDVSVTQDKHALMTLSNLYGNIYMNVIGFA